METSDNEMDTNDMEKIINDCVEVRKPSESYNALVSFKKAKFPSRLTSRQQEIRVSRNLSRKSLTKQTTNY